MDGGQIMVFANASDAEEMHRWFLMVSNGSPFNIHEYREGAVVLRLTDRLTDEQAAAYDRALQQLLSQPATPSGG